MSSPSLFSMSLKNNVLYNLPSKFKIKLIILFQQNFSSIQSEDFHLLDTHSRDLAPIYPLPSSLCWSFLYAPGYRGKYVYLYKKKIKEKKKKKFIFQHPIMHASSVGAKIFLITSRLKNLIARIPKSTLSDQEGCKEAFTPPPPPQKKFSVGENLIGRFF